MKRKQSTVRDRRSRSAISNGSRLLPAGIVDGRSSEYRRRRDLTHAYFNDLGGEDALSEGQRTLVRRVVTLTIELERMEARFVVEDGATPAALETYQRSTNTLRRQLETLGLHRGRKPRDVTPPDLHQYIASRTNGHARRNGRVRVIDHMEDDA